MNAPSTSFFQARLDPEEKGLIVKAAKLRGISQTDYLKAILIPFAKQELSDAEQGGVKLSKDEQELFWKALNKRVVLGKKQKEMSVKIKEFL